MGILQGLLAYLRRSASKLVQAIFGWAVRALFGTVAESEKTLLSIVVGAAAIWPLLLVGVPFPRAAAFILAFVPIPRWVPAGWIRAVWIAAAALVPVGVGIALAHRGDARRAGSRWKTALQGFPVTAALSAAFLTAFVTSPVRRLIALARRREDLTIPLLLEREEYDAAAEMIRTTLESRDLHVHRADPPWLLTAPSRVLRAIGGRILRDRIPADLHFFRGRDLDVVVNPNGVTLQGEKKTAARAHGLISEKATLGPGLQTVETNAQALERELKDVWVVFARDRAGHAGSAVLLGALDALSRKLGRTNLPFDDWQVLYREILQVSRAIRGDPQVLGTKEEESMAQERRPAEAAPREGRPAAQWPPRAGRPVAAMSTPRLVAGLTAELRELVEKEVALARAELRVDLKAGMKSAKWLGLAGVAALVALNLLFVAAALWLARWLAPPLAALIVAGGLLALAAAFGWLGKAALVRPLETTRRTLNEGWTWAKKRIA